MGDWTEGPWIAKKTDEELEVLLNEYEIQPANGGLGPIALVGDLGCAQLVAAAPEMAEALRRLAAAVMDQDVVHGMEEELDAALAALSKARGES